jgi:hypothetical protein
MKHKNLEAMRLAEQERRLDGRVEIDDAYLGGEFNGRSTGARRRQQGALRGRRADHRRMSSHVRLPAAAAPH